MLGRETNLVPELQVETEFHGSAYGGWAIRRDSLTEGSRVISVGVGEDVSFDLSLIEKYRCQIHAFDPTPKSVDWVRRNVSQPNFHFEPIALGDKDGPLRLFLPKNPGHVSASCRESAHVQSVFFDAPCLRLSSMLHKLGWDTVDILKMDIEGAEYAVIDDLVTSRLAGTIDQLLIEFHDHFSSFSAADTKKAVAALEKHGLVIAWVSESGHEVLFVRNRKMPGRAT